MGNRVLEMIALAKRGVSYREIGAVFGVSRQRVHQIIGGGWNRMSRRGRNAIRARPRLTEATLNDFAEAEPRILRCENGGFLAVSPENAVVGIGVFAWSGQGAKDNYSRARREWYNALRDVLLDPDWSRAARLSEGTPS